MFRSICGSRMMVSALSLACVLSTQATLATSMSASPLRVNIRIPAPAGAKMVHMTVMNTLPETLQLKVGDTPVTIEAGATVDLIVATGTKIVNSEATKTHAAGVVFIEVTKDLSGATLRIS